MSWSGGGIFGYCSIKAAATSGGVVPLERQQGRGADRGRLLAVEQCQQGSQRRGPFQLAEGADEVGPLGRRPLRIGSAGGRQRVGRLEPEPQRQPDQRGARLLVVQQRPQDRRQRLGASVEVQALHLLFHRPDQALAVVRRRGKSSSRAQVAKSSGFASAR